MEYKLSELFDLQMGKTPDRKNNSFWNTKDNKWLSIADLSKSNKYVSITKEYISDEAVAKSGIKVIPADTVVMSFKLSIGKVAICKEDLYSNEAIMAFLDKGKIKILSDYLYYLLLSKDWDEGSNKAVMGHTLNKATLSDMTISVHNIKEQQQIADTLDRVSHLLSLRQQQLEKLDLLVKSRFIEMFGDPVRNDKNWDKKTLKDVCIKLNDGTHFSPESFEKGDYKYITAKNIKIDGFDFSNITYVSEEIHRPIYQRCNPEKGDVLYIKDGVTTGIAMVNTLDEEFTLLSSVALLKQNRKIINGHFLCGVLNNAEMYANIRANMGGAAITRLTITKLNGIMIILPPLDLQNQFATFVQQVDKSKFVIKQSIEKLELLKNKLMQDYFG